MIFRFIVKKFFENLRFLEQIWRKITITRKIKIGEFFLLFFPYYITHSPSSIKGWSKVRGEVCMSVIGTNPYIHIYVYIYMHIYVCKLGWKGRQRNLRRVFCSILYSSWPTFKRQISVFSTAIIKLLNISLL